MIKFMIVALVSICLSIGCFLANVIILAFGRYIDLFDGVLIAFLMSATASYCSISTYHALTTEDEDN